MSKVFCLILSYNLPQDTIKCAQSLLKSHLPQDTHLIIIDNAPINRNKYFRSHVPLAIYLKSPSNLGFAAGNNQGIKYALDHGATHVLIINPDVVVPQYFLTPLLKLDKDLVAPAHTEGLGSFGLGGIINWKWGSFQHENVTQLPHQPCKFDFLTFACVLIKREVFEKVGFLDEHYFLYLEDVDYCVTATRGGFLLYLNPTVIVNHKTSSSFADPRAKIKYSFRSSFLFIRKWYTFPHYILPLIYALYFYPATYLLWTFKLWFPRPLIPKT